ncbi:hypothetical protein I350_04210 [Cryptococcus amylolentus CBS 6273]|uniref:Phospholipid scramblase n=1 Tax=Cryptococcus amylolentus CBS 6273 TaxID=1296118 RepID=A0A1E3K169_9TREE|nr:hypothetical protein I350_04210 [Cryptococcus amylolentus CBS 6273]
MLARTIHPSRPGPSTALLRPALAATRPLTTSLPALRQRDPPPRGHVRPAPPRRPIRPSTFPAADPNTTAQYPPFSVEGIDLDTPVYQSGHVNIPPDPEGVLGDSHAARQVLGHESLVVVRQLEMLNVFMGFEQANRYALHSPDGQLVGLQEQGYLSAISRQMLRTHRPFRSVIMDRTGKPVLWIRRPFAFINSRIFVHSSEAAAADSTLVGETQQSWHPWRRRYNLFQTREHGETFRQFAKIDSGFLAWDFWLKDRGGRLVASINRNFRGLGRELFTDTGQYVIRFDSAGTELDLAPGSNVNLQGQSLILPQSSEGGLTLDQRAMALATAVSIDFDFFSRHSGSGGMGFPLFFWGGGDGGADAQAGSRPSDVQGSDVAGGAAAGAMGSAAGGLSEDEQIYGRQPPSAEPGSAPPPAPAPDQGQYGWPETWPEDMGGGVEGLEGYREEAGWSEDEVMQDPWGQQQGGGDDGGWFGGGDGGWGE